MITDAHIENYQTQGFLPWDREILKPHEVAETLERVENIVAGHSDFPESCIQYESQGEAGVVRKLLSLSYFDPYFEALAKRRDIVDLVEGLIGSDIKLYTDEFFMKNPARDDGPYKGYRWHQDAVKYPHFAPKDTIATLWIALDDATRENGCLNFIPGSHLWGPVDGKRARVLMDNINVASPVAVEVKAGRGVFHDGLNLHCSHDNRSNKPRRSLAFHYMKSRTLFLGFENEAHYHQFPDTTEEGLRFMSIRGKEYAGCV